MRYQRPMRAMPMMQSHRSGPMPRRAPVARPQPVARGPVQTYRAGPTPRRAPVARGPVQRPVQGVVRGRRRAQGPVRGGAGYGNRRYFGPRRY